jgi:predicted Ser/Thr protein kinase
MSNLNVIEQELASLQVKINEAEQKRNEAEKSLVEAIEQEKPESILNNLRALYEGAVSELKRLRQEKVALLKEMQLLIGSQSLTFEELLNTEIPDLGCYKSKSKNKTGIVPTHPRECGERFEKWDSFEAEVNEFWRVRGTKPLLSTRLNFRPQFETQECGNELEVQDRMLPNIFKPVQELLNALGIPSLFKRPGSDNQVLFDPDFVWNIGVEDNNSLGAVIEVKSWWSFETIEDVVSQYKKDTEVGLDNKLVKAMQQIYGYMSYNNLRYGIVSTYKGTYFLKRRKESILSISRPILNIHCAIFKYWVYILFQSKEDGFYSSPTGDPFENCSKKIERISFGSGCKYNLTAIKASQIQLADFIERKRNGIAKGCVGSVISGKIAGVDAEIKLKMVDSFNIADALRICETEVAFYRHLESLQGSIIPQFYGFFNLHGFLILALEDCGKPIGHEDYQLFNDQIENAVSQIKSLGVDHEDLESRDGIYPNILIKNKSIRIIDFHVSKARNAKSIKRVKY